ncbi:MAG: hypothetical protein R3F43_23990 [bacterium]
MREASMEGFQKNPTFAKPGILEHGKSAAQGRRGAPRGEVHLPGLGLQPGPPVGHVHRPQHLHRLQRLPGRLRV